MDDEALSLRVTVIGGQSYADDYTVIWRGLPIGRIMRPPGLPPHVLQWRWTCFFYGKPAGGGGAGSDLNDCKAQFGEAWASIRAGLSERDIARAHEYGDRKGGRIERERLAVEKETPSGCYPGGV